MPQRLQEPHSAELTTLTLPSSIYVLRIVILATESIQESVLMVGLRPLEKSPMASDEKIPYPKGLTQPRCQQQLIVLSFYSYFVHHSLSTPFIFQCPDSDSESVQLLLNFSYLYHFVVSRI